MDIRIFTNVTKTILETLKNNKMTKHEATLALIRTYLDDLRTKLDERQYVDGDFNEEECLINDIEILINSLD